MMANEIDFIKIFTQGSFSLLSFFLIFLFFLLIVMWIVLPLAVFKMKSILNESYRQLIRMNKSISNIEAALTRITASENPYHNTADDNAISAGQSTGIRLKSESGDTQ